MLHTGRALVTHLAPVGWTAAGRKTGGKSGLHEETMPVNGRRGRPQG